MATLIPRATAWGTALLVAVLAATGCGGPFDAAQLSRDVETAFRMGDLDIALELAERGSRRAGSLDDADWETRFALWRAEILIARGSPDTIQEAELLIAETYDAAGRDPSIRTRWHYLRGYARHKLGRGHEALTELGEASRIALEQSLPAVAIDAAFVQGFVLTDLERHTEAESRRLEALSLARESADRFRTAAGLVNLSLSCIRGRRYDEAITLLEEAADLAGEEGADLLQAAILLDIALCWSLVGDLERALGPAMEAVTVYRHAGARLYMTQGLGTLGQIRAARGETGEALEALREAVTIARELRAASEDALWSLEIGRTLIGAGDLEAAPEWIDMARAGYRASDVKEGLAAADLVEASLAAARGENQRVVRLCESVISTFAHEPALLWRAQAELARALRRAGKTDEARARFADAVASIRKDRDRLDRKELKAAFLTRPIGVYQNFVAMLLEIGDEDEALRVIESSRAQTLLDGMEVAEAGHLDVDSLVKLARAANVTLLSYWISPRGAFAWTFSAAGSRRTPLPGVERLAELVGRHRAMIEEGWRDPLDSDQGVGRELYELLVAPVLDVAPAGSRVIVVPDRPLHRLNLETLVAAGTPPHYLIEDWVVSVAPALTLLLAEPPARPGGVRSVLLVGDPIENDPEFPRLPHASMELDTIAGRLQAYRVEQLRGEEATAAAVLGRLGRSYDWIHFAAHAQPSAGNPFDSAVVLSPGPNGTMLYARDLVERRIDAELVTLSACRSAGSRAFSGEGLVGFSWTFMRAGTPRVVAGMWDVSDRSTVALMDEMYVRLARGDEGADALRAAKLRLLRSDSAFAKPFYWGSFQMHTRVARP